MGSEPPEKILLAATLRGDRQAFGEIIKRYQHPVYALALQITADPAAASDIAQETFVTAFKALKGLHAKDSFAPWLRKIARNTALAWLRERRRSAPLEEAEEPRVAPSRPEVERRAEQVEAGAFRGEINRIVFSLSEALRLPILLCYVNGLPTAEAARFLGIKEGTLRKRLHDGKKKLQKAVVSMAEKTLQEYRLPPGFARRCICGCERSKGKEVIPHGRKRKVRLRMCREHEENP